MAENENQSGAQHLTSLDIDISGIYTSLQTAQQEIERMSVEAGKTLNGNLQKAVQDASKIKIKAPTFLNDSELDAAKSKLEQIADSYGKLAKTVMTYDAENNLLSGSVTYDDSNGKKVVEQYRMMNDEWTHINTTRTNDIQKRENLERKEAEKTQKLRMDFLKKLKKEYKHKIDEERKAEEELQNQKDAFYKKNISQADAELKERERQGKVFSAQLKERLQIQAREAQTANKAAAKIDSMIEKQRQFNTLVSKQKSSGVNRQILADSEKYIQQLEVLRDTVRSTGKYTDEAERQFADLQRKIKELSGYYEEAGSKGDSFLKKIADKAKWLGAFYIVNELRQGLIKTVETIKQTEDAVVDLQRVLNEDISQTTMSKELYDIAYEYGRVFSDVSEVSTAFAQAGYGWNDVLKLTEGTMLALNTAELDVTQSTQGLIAIMKQWGFEAEDYASVIDRINITADSFAVTSENIVAALQRASSSAKNANISFERTIGIITALAEATGRSGENIGTALNSLIIYTSNNKSLQTFAENGSQAMKDLVKAYQAGSASIYDIWMQLSKEVKDLSASQQAALFDSEAYEEFADTLSEQASEFATDVNEIYGTAGKYRQNYFIALLNDLSTAEEAVKNMADVEGYSANENKRYMETLTAQWNQLKDMLAQIAVQLGEAGLMDALKGLTQIGITIAKLTKDMGGILKILEAIAGVMLVIKRQKIQGLVSSIRNDIIRLKVSLTDLYARFVAANGIVAKTKVLIGGLSSSVSTLTATIGLLTIAISAASMVYNLIKTRAEEARNAAIDANNKVVDQTDKITKLVSQYNSLASVSNRTAEQEASFRSVNEQITKELGSRAEALSGLTAGTKEYTEQLNEMTKAELENRRVALQSNVTQQGQAFVESSKDFFGFDGRKTNIQIAQLESTNKQIEEIVKNNLDTFEQWSVKAKQNYYGALSNDEKGLSEWIMALRKTKDELDSLGAKSNELAETIANDPAYKKISDVLNSMSEPFQNYINAQIEAAANEVQLSQGIPKTAEELENFKDAVFDATGANTEFKDVIYEIVSSMFPALSSGASYTANEISSAFGISVETIKALEEEIKSLNGSIDEFQSSYSALNDAVEEYNSTGYLSVDTIQKLLSLGSEYVSVLNFTADGVTLNTSKAQDLFHAQKQNIDALIQQTTYSGLLEIAQRYLGESTDQLSESNENSHQPISETEKALYSLSETAIGATFNIAAAGKAIDEAFGKKTNWNNLHNMKNEMLDYLSTMNSLSRSTRNLAQNEKAWVGSKNDSVKRQNDAQKKALEAEKKAIKSRYDAEIKALKELKKEKDRQRKDDEYWRKRQEALKEISKAETRSGVEFREKEDDARAKLEELDRKHLEMLEDWSIDDRIKELEKLRDTEIAALDAQIANLQNTVANVGNSTVKTMSNANKASIESYNKEYLEPFAEDTKQTYVDVYSQLPAVFGDALGQMLEMSKFNSAQMYNIYNANLFAPMKKSMAEIRQNMMPFTVSQPRMPQFYADPRTYQSSNITTNNTRNANVFANVYNQNSANSIFGGFFTKP